MRARNLKPGFFKNEILAECSYPARIFFAGLWLCADREGRLEDRPQRLKAEILPYGKEDPEKLLQELASKADPDGKPAFILRYAINGGGKYIQVVHFPEHQNPHIRESESKIPPPPDPLPILTNESPFSESIYISHGVPSTVQAPDKHSAKTVLGEFNNVLLSAAELQKLRLKFGETGTKERIESLSAYMASKGKKYKNHCATIMNWENFGQKANKKTKFQREMEALATFDQEEKI